MNFNFIKNILHSLKVNETQSSVEPEILRIGYDFPKGTMRFKDMDGKWRFIDFDTAKVVMYIKYIDKCYHFDYKNIVNHLKENLHIIYKSVNGNYASFSINGETKKAEVISMSKDDVDNWYAYYSMENWKKFYQNAEFHLIDSEFGIECIEY